MAIQTRRGNFVDFDPENLLEGEVASVLDKKYVYVGMPGGQAVQLGTMEKIEEVLDEAEEYRDEAMGYRNDALGYKNDAETSKNTASTKSLESEGYAVGTQNGVPVTSGSPYYENNAKYYKDLAQSGALGTWASLQGKPFETLDSETLEVNGGVLKVIGGGSPGTTDYNDLTNKPSINGVTLSGNKSLGDLSIPTQSDVNAKADYITYDDDSNELSLRSGGESGTVLATVTVSGGGTIQSTIQVTTESDEFEGLTVSCVGAGESKTGTFSSKSVVFKVSSIATYTISVTYNGEVYSTTVNASTLGGYYTATLNYEAYGYQGWLDSANITKSFSSLLEVLADESTVAILMTKHASVDYLVEWFEKDDTLASTILASDNALKWIGLKDYAYDNMPSSFITSWLASEKWEYALKDKVPTMTSNTSPSGEVTSSGLLASTYIMFAGYTSGSNNYGTINTVASANSWVQYKFTNPNVVKKVKIITRDADDRSILSYKISASNDNSTFTDLTDTIVNSNPTKCQTLIATFNNETPYLYYRLTVLSCQGDSGYEYPQITQLQFYGRSLTVSVPTMTSNNAPSGEVSASSEFKPAYCAFDKVISTTINTNEWVANSGANESIQYTFDKAMAIKSFSIVQGVYEGNSRAKDYVLKAKNDGEWVTLKSGTFENDNTNKVQMFNVSCDVAYKTYKVEIANLYSSGAWISLRELNFYGKDYSENITLTIHSAKEDTIYYYDSGVETTLVKFSSGATSGSATIPIDTLANGLTLYSSVAKDTTSGTSDYSKNVSLSDSTSEIKLMPDYVLYWYGYLGDNAEVVTPQNGWSSAYQTVVNCVSFGTHSYTINCPNNSTGGVGTKNKVSGYTKLGVVGRRINTCSIVMLANDTKLASGGAYVASIGNTTTTLAKADIPDDKYINVGTYTSSGVTGSVEVNAIWLE